MKKIIFALGCAVFLLGAPQAAPAAAAGESITLVYNVHASGFRAFRMTLKTNINPQDYTLDMDVVTQGTVNFLLPWEGSYVTTGTVRDGRLSPQKHVSVGSWEKDRQTTTLRYGNNGRVIDITEEEDGKTKVKKDIAADLTENTTDLLTAIVQVFRHTRQTGNCNSGFEVFDGKRRFRLDVAEKGRDRIEKSRYASFSGEALRCTLKVEPIKGFRKRDYKRGWLAVQAHTEARKQLPTLWLAPLTDGGPVVPVRLELASAYGSVVAHLASAQVD